MRKRTAAIITGWALILMAVIGGFSLGYAFPEFYTPDATESLRDNMLNNSVLYQYMIFGILFTLILDLIVSYTLYAYFKADNRIMSSISGVARFIYTIIFGIATFYLVQNVTIDNPSNQFIKANFALFQSIWSSGLLIFGAHIILIGILMKIHKIIPKILWYLTIIAGVSYIIIHLSKLLNLDPAFVSYLEIIFSLPMIIGELGLAIWLLVKGGKDNNIEHVTSR